MKSKYLAVIILVLSAANSVFAQTRKPAAAAKPETRSLSVVTEPNAWVWLDDLRRGTTNDKGILKIERVTAGAHSLRVRAVGFAEKTQAVAPAARGEIRVALAAMTDDAELAFQEAESLRDGGREAERAERLYRRAFELRPRFAEAHVGLARLLTKSNFEEALAQIAEARRDKPNFAEASTVEGRIYLDNSDAETAVKSFQRALREARNRSPEAHVGLARAAHEGGDYESAVASYKTALAQLADSEPAIYQLLGETYERMQRNKDAIAVYEKFLQLAPDSVQASAVRSIIVQLKKPRNDETVELMPQ